MPAFDILTVGGGLVGLASSIFLRKKGHSVRVIEASANLSVIGDSIALVANQQRVLDRFGILNDLKAITGEDVGTYYHRRYSTGEPVSVREMTLQEKNYGYATYIMSRAGYQQFLYDQAKEHGVEFHFGSRVESLEDNKSRPAVILKDGTRLEADIVIGADGVKSLIRRSLHPHISLTSSSSCYRTTVPHSLLSPDPSLHEFMSGINFNMGPGRIVIQSNMSDIGAVSLNMYHSGDKGTAGSYKEPGNIEKLRETFKDFYPQIRKIVGFVDECVSWKVMEVPPLPSWVSEGGKVVLMGDAAHAMTPHQGQGCSQGVEDAAALTECLARAKSIEDVPALLKKYEDIRKARAELLVKTSAQVGKVWSLPDGEEQQQRDEKMRNAPMWSAGGWDGKPIDQVPSGLADSNYNSWVMSHDVIDYTNRKLDGLVNV